MNPGDKALHCGGPGGPGGRGAGSRDEDGEEPAKSTPRQTLHRPAASAAIPARAINEDGDELRTERRFAT